MRFLAVAFGGAIGSSLRWWLGLLLNPLFPTLPLGTLAANLSGGYLIGVMVALLQIYSPLPEILRLGVITGFLGGLTTFSTFSAETIHLFSTKSYLFATVSIMAHVGGSLLMTVLGIFSMKLLFSRWM